MQELDIRAVIALLISKLKWIIAAAVVLAVGFGLYTRFMIPNTYRSEVQMYVSNYTDLTQAQGATTGGLTASQQLVNEYIVILRNDKLLSLVANALQQQEGGYVMTPAAIRAVSSMSSVNETAMLNIAVTTTDPALSKALCDVFARVAPAQLEAVMEMGTIKPMEQAKIGVKIGPNVPKNAILGGFIGAVIACAIIIIMYLFDNTVTGERELKRRLDVTVLGEVPSLQPDKKGGKKNDAGK